MAGRCSLTPLGGFGGPHRDYKITVEHLQSLQRSLRHCTELLASLAYLVNITVRVVLRHSLNEQHSSHPGSAVFGLFLKLREQAGSFASSKIAGPVLAYSYRASVAGWVQVGRSAGVLSLSQLCLRK